MTNRWIVVLVATAALAVLALIVIPARGPREAHGRGRRGHAVRRFGRRKGEPRPMRRRRPPPGTE